MPKPKGILVVENPTYEIPDLKVKFDRVVLINLRRRPDRLANVRKELNEKGWCFGPIEIFEAVDGKLVPTPYAWQEGDGAWGCMQSHRQILERAIMDGVENLLVLEDDLCIKSSFICEIKTFLDNIPEDWDQLMFGGQHLEEPDDVKPGIVKCNNCQRTHAYGIRGKFMRELYARWCSPLSKVHCDWIMGPLQKKFNVYAPDPFIFGQGDSQSDISGRFNNAKFWTPPLGDEIIFVFDCPKEAIQGLRDLNRIHTGYNRDLVTDIDNGLLDIFKYDNPEHRLKDWISDLMWEVTSRENVFLGVWHPQTDFSKLSDAVRKCWKGQVYDVICKDVETAYRLMEMKMSSSEILF